MNKELQEFVSRQNIERYKRLLKSQLEDHERAFIERRIAEETRNLQLHPETASTIYPTLKSIAFVFTVRFTEFSLPLFNVAEQNILA